MKNLTRTAKRLIIATIMALCFTSARAQEAWAVAGTADLNTGSNWFSGTVPTSTQIATFTESDYGNITPTFSASTAWGEIEVDSSQTGTVSLNSASPVTLTLGAGPSGFNQTILQTNSGSGALTLGSNVSILLATNTTSYYINPFSPDTSSNTTVGNIVIDGAISSSATSGTSIIDVIQNPGYGYVKSPAATFNGTISDGTSGGKVGLTFSGYDVLNPSSPNTYTGPTLISSPATVNADATGSIPAGSALTVNSALVADHQNAIESTSIVVNSGGSSNITIYSNYGVSENGTPGTPGAQQTITLNGGSIIEGFSGITDGVDRSANIVMEGGTLKLNGANQTLSGLGTLTLQSGVNTIALKGLLTVDNIVWDAGATLLVTGWTGTSAGGDASDQITFGSGAAWTTVDANLGNISWESTSLNSGAATTYDNTLLTGTVGTGGQIVPEAVPEPSVVFLGLFSLLALLGRGARAKLIEVGRSLKRA